MKKITCLVLALLLAVAAIACACAEGKDPKDIRIALIVQQSDPWYTTWSWVSSSSPRTPAWTPSS